MCGRTWCIYLSLYWKCILKILNILLEIHEIEAVDMVQSLRAPADLSENLGFVSNIHMASHNHL